MFVSDGYGNSRVAKFDKDGNFVKDWGERGNQPGDFNTPHSLVVDNNDVVYVADRGNSRIQVFDTEGNRKAVWNLPTAPWALCLTNGPNQVMFVGSVGRVYKMDLTGKILGVFGRPGRMPGTIDSIHGIACPDEKPFILPTCTPRASTNGSRSSRGSKQAQTAIGTQRKIGCRSCGSGLNAPTIPRAARWGVDLSRNLATLTGRIWRWRPDSITSGSTGTI